MVGRDCARARVHGVLYAEVYKTMARMRKTSLDVDVEDVQTVTEKEAGNDVWQIATVVFPVLCSKFQFNGRDR